MGVEGVAKLQKSNIFERDYAVYTSAPGFYKSAPGLYKPGPDLYKPAPDL